MFSKLMVSITTIIASIILFILSINIPEARETVVAGPKLWPILLTVILFFSGVALFFRDLKSSPEESDAVKQIAPEDEEKLAEPELVYPRKFWLNILLFAAYIIIMGYIGFIFTTFIFMLAGIWVMGKGKHTFLFSLLVTVFFVVVFPISLQLYLPRGVGWFREISFLLY